MHTIQVVLDEDLLGQTDQAARKIHVNRSALIRKALKEYLWKLEVQEREQRDREAYERMPAQEDELADLEAVVAWPEE